MLLLLIEQELHTHTLRRPFPGPVRGDALI